MAVVPLRAFLDHESDACGKRLVGDICLCRCRGHEGGHTFRAVAGRRGMADWSATYWDRITCARSGWQDGFDGKARRRAADRSKLMERRSVQRGSCTQAGCYASSQCRSKAADARLHREGPRPGALAGRVRLMLRLRFRVGVRVSGQGSGAWQGQARGSGSRQGQVQGQV